jgi:hypothetical protein
MKLMFPGELNINEKTRFVFYMSSEITHCGLFHNAIKCMHCTSTGSCVSANVSIRVLLLRLLLRVGRGLQTRTSARLLGSANIRTSCSRAKITMSLLSKNLHL